MCVHIGTDGNVKKKGKDNRSIRWQFTMRERKRAWKERIFYDQRAGLRFGFRLPISTSSYKCT